MKSITIRSLLAVATCSVLLINRSVAQDAAAPASAPAAKPAPAADDDVVKLPTFEVSSSSDKDFVGTSSLSSTRIAVDLSELPQSVKVLNNSFIEAIGPNMLSDILDYVGGGQNGQLNWTSGRMNIRGFTGDADYVDGFAPPSATAQDAVMFDRFEIIKGPSSIFLAADGSPGGIENKISKDPLSDPMTAITVQTGIFGANKADVDTTGPITADKKLSYRVVASESYWNDYYTYTYMHRFMGYGALEYAFNSNTKLTLKAEMVRVAWPSYNGLPVDPRTLQMMNLPYDSTQDLPKDANWRRDRVNRLWGEFNSRVNEHVALSVRAMRAYDQAPRLEAIAPTWSEGTTTGTALINGVSTPVTFLGGKWTNPTVSTSETLAPVNYVVKNGAIYVTDPWAGASNYVNGGPIPRSTINADDAHSAYNDVQADVNFNFETKWFEELLLVGGEHRDSPGFTITWKNGVSASPWYPLAEGTPGAVTTNYVTPSAFTHTQSLQNRAYALDTLKLLKSRVILSYGVSRAETFSSTYNDLAAAYSGAPGGYYLFKNLVQAGAVVKVLENISLFAGTNQNFAANGTGTLNGVANSVLPPKSGSQVEIGLKMEFFDKRLSFNISHFDVTQKNNTAPSFPSDPLNPNILIPGVLSRGFDGDWSYKATSNIYFIGSFANYSAKSVLSPAYDGNQGGLFLQPGTDHVAYSSIPVDNTAEQTASLYALYKFTGSTLRGLTAGLGGNYQSKRAITDGANQVFWGYIPKRTILNLNLTYDYNKHLSYRLSIDNLLDKKYIYSSRSEDVIVPGTPTNLKFSVSYKL